MSDYRADREYLIPGEKATLSSEDEQLIQPAFRRRRSRQSKPKLFFGKIIIIHASILLTYTILLVTFAAWLQKTSGIRRTVAYAPFTPEPQAVTFDHDHSIYVGEPSPAIDDAWSKLLKNTNVRITEDEIKHLLDRTDNAIALPDGGYFAALNTFHNLHCIKRIHHYMYEDHYFPNITRRQKAANEFHNHHCLDMLRQSIMCQADMQLLTMRWRPDSRVPTANWTAPHQCANWNQVEEWAGSRRIAQLMEPGYLNHPTLGPAYPDGRGSVIGETLPSEED